MSNPSWGISQKEITNIQLSTKEEISDPGSELAAVEAGLVIHASSREKQTSNAACLSEWPSTWLPQRLSELTPTPGRPANADGTRVGDIYITHPSSYPTLKAGSVVIERRPGSSTTITNTHGTCK